MAFRSAHHLRINEHLPVTAARKSAHDPGLELVEPAIRLSTDSLANLHPATTINTMMLHEPFSV